MPGNKYADFDLLLISLIKNGYNTFTQLEGNSELRRMAKVFCPDASLEFRVIDRRLQANRKAGKIRYAGTVWVLSDN